MAHEEAPDRWLRWRQVRDLTGLGRTTAWRMRQDGDFPQPVPISPGRVAWRERDIVAWNATRGIADRMASPRLPRSPVPPAVRRPCEPRVMAPLPEVEPAPKRPSPACPGRPRTARRVRAAVAEGQLVFDF